MIVFGASTNSNFYNGSLRLPELEASGCKFQRKLKARRLLANLSGSKVKEASARNSIRKQKSQKLVVANV